MYLSENSFVNPATNGCPSVCNALLIAIQNTEEWLQSGHNEDIGEPEFDLRLFLIIAMASLL